MAHNGSDSEPHSRSDILGLMDSFIEQIQQIRKFLLGVSISAIILAPLAIALSLYLILHPSFYSILETENEFGFILTIMLGAVILISGVWFSVGIRQYRSMSIWRKRYAEYSNEKAELDKKIASQFGLDQQE